MKPLPVQTGKDNKILRTISKSIPKVTKSIKNFALEMINSMIAENGVGLAAPQAGQNIRMVVCKFNPGQNNELMMPFVNPELIHVSEEMEEGEEGCLSLPGIWGMVPRHKSVMVRFQNLKGSTQTLEFHDFNARIIQHEMDHLDGILFIDRATQINKESKGEEHVHI
jgi:peptide deformylase